MRSRSAAATATACPRQYANLRTSGPAAPTHGTNLEVIRNEDGRRRFEWMDCELAREEVTDIRCSVGQRVLIQRSIVDPSLSWVVSQVHDSANRDLPDCDTDTQTARPGPCFNIRSARSKLMARERRRDRPLPVRPRRARGPSSPIR